MKTLKVNPLTLARILIILQLVTLSVSTAASSVSEALIYLAFISFSPLRRRVLNIIRQPMVVMTLVIWAMVGIGVFYSVAPFADALGTCGGWRKCLMLPLAAAVYDDPVWKKRFLWIFLGLMTLAATLSSAGHLFNFTVYPKLPIGIVISNHATQGMFFAAAAFACLVILRFTRPKHSWLLWCIAALITSNLIFITDGRSGYLAFLVCLMMLTFWGSKGWLRIFLLFAAPAVIALLLVLSPVAKDAIQKGLQEMQTYENAPENSSIGTRINLWKNTLGILKKMEHPLIGYGTDGFKIPYAEQVKGVTGWQAVSSIDDPHNQYLKILVEYGLAGLVLFLLFLASFFRQAVPPPFYYLGIGILMAWSATSLFNGNFSTFHEGRFLFLWCGVMLGPEREKKEGQPPVESGT